jgi:WD40 repeat protein
LNPARALATNPDGRRLFAWVPGNERFTTLKSFDPNSGKEIFSYSDSGRTVLAVCFSNDGKRSALGARDGSLRIIDLELQQAVPGGDWFLFEKEVGVGALTFDRDRRTLYCGGNNGEVKVATVAERKVLLNFKAHTEAVTACVLSPDGRRLATTGFDNEVKLWELPGAKLIQTWRLQPPSPVGAAFVRQLAFTAAGDLITANANTTQYLLRGK